MGLRGSNKTIKAVILNALFALYFLHDRFVSCSGFEVMKRQKHLIICIVRPPLIFLVSPN